MSTEFPDFQVQVRGFNRDQVIDYVERLHGEIESLEGRVRQLRQDASGVQTERTRLTEEIAQVRGDVLSALRDIQGRIETAIRRDKISLVKTPPSREAAEKG
ncbi:hypothetical protein [Mycobacterium sp.]|uniref:hypothetical protein n=1 Tax=Mycobacterium sp. TaxID=1785 RepID=UPI003A84ECF6